MESRGYDYGSGAGTGAVGKIRRHPPSRAVAASPYARPATAPTHATGTATAAVSQGGGWLSRIIATSTSRFLPSLFRTSPPQLTAPTPPPHELLEEPPTRDQLPVDAPPSPLPPPLEDDLPECEENGGVAANNLCTENPQSSAKEEENMLRNSDDHGGMALEELLNQRTFTRIKLPRLQKLQKHMWVQNLPRVPLYALDCMIPPLCLSDLWKLVCYKKLSFPQSHLPKAQDRIHPKLLIVLKATIQHRVERSTKCRHLLISRVVFLQRSYLVLYPHIIRP